MYAIATLWLCIYVTHDPIPKTYSVTYTDAAWAQAEARDACEAHSTTCEFKGCREYHPGRSLPPSAYLCWCPTPHEKCAFSIQYADNPLSTEVWGASTGEGCSTGNLHASWPLMSPARACAKVQAELCSEVKP